MNSSYAGPDLSQTQTDVRVSGGDQVDFFSPTLQGQSQDVLQLLNLQGTDTPDLWQAPLSFEWDQWEAYVEKFPGESLDLNET